MKTIKVDHVILTLALSSVALTMGGESRDSLNEKINKRLVEGGFDEVEVIPLRTNFDERQQATHVVNEYIFRAYEKEGAVKEAKSKKADA